MRRLIFPTVILSLLIPAAQLAATAGEASPEAFTIRLTTPPLQLRQIEEGVVGLELDGFHTRVDRPGVPDVPTRTLLVAIPADATPRLTVEPTGVRSRRAVRPAPVPRVVATEPQVETELDGSPRRLRRGIDTSRTRRWLDEDAEVYQGRDTYPRRVAWLGEVGVLRDQRYVPVHVAPVRYDGRTGGLVIESELLLTVHFDGAAPGVSVAPEESRFEPVYRDAFANYAQGRSFRLDSGSPPEAAAAQAGASGPLRRIVVRGDGIVRLDFDLFDQEASDFLATDPTHWRLTNRGEQVPLQIRQNGGGNDALLEPGEHVQFFGQKLDDEAESELIYVNPAGAEDLYEARDFSDENVYFLTVEAGSQPTITELDATPTAATPETSFVSTTRSEIDDLFMPLPDEFWFWLPFISESSTTRTESVALPDLASGTDPASVRVGVRGASSCHEVDPDHKTWVSLVNDLAQTLDLPGGNPDNEGNQNAGEYDGNTLFVHEFDWSHSGGDPQLTDPLDVVLEAAVLDIACPSGPGGNVINDVILDFIEIDYSRAFVAVDDGLIFDWPDGDAEIEIEGFDSSEVEVYEVTGLLPGTPVVDAVRLTNVSVTSAGPSFTARFHIANDGSLPDGTPRRFVAAGAAGISIPAPADFQADRVSNLKSDTSQADLIVAVHPDLVDSACTVGGNPCSYDVDCVVNASDVCELEPSSSLQALLDHRAGQGISSRVARLQDVYDEFNDGLEGPVAIRNFVSWAYNGGWEGEPPSFLMLLGDGSYDYKGGPAEGNFVPTQIVVKENEILGYFSSDNLIGAVAGDDFLADLVVGRITSRDLSQAEGVLDKIHDYEVLTPAGDWRSSTLLMSDRGKGFSQQEAEEFERINDIGPGFFEGSDYTSTHLRYWSDNCGGVPANCNPNQMNAAIKNHINGVIGDGVALAQFMGHGNFDLWSDDVIFCTDESLVFCPIDDSESLNNGLRLPWLVVHNCLTGGYHTPEEKSFGEQWLKRLLGGSMAVFAPSGLGFRFLGEDVTEEVWEDVFGPPKAREIAVPVMSALTRLCGQGSIEGCQFYTLLGDPASSLMLPDVGPPTGETATPSTGTDFFVDLDWNASSTPGATYNVYRTQNLSGDYVQIAGDVAGSSYTDEGVVPAQTYYYYVTAELDGFESAWSNFNSDCGGGEDPPGPDCLVGEPLNLVPPATPSGVTATDDETGGSLTVSWNPNVETDIQSYIVHYGTDESLGLTKTFPSWKTSVQLTGLENGTEYFTSVQARNTSGTESLLSSPVSATPNLVLGLKSPGFIGDLMISKSGSHAVLTWSAVTTDIYGKATTVGLYEVYRGETADFVPSLANRIGLPTSTAFIDLNALTPGGPDYHYLVRAVDVGGNVGGLGAQLPSGITGLQIGRSESTPGNLVISWPEVTEDFDGRPTLISHYEVYAADTPFTREDIRDGAVTPLIANQPGNSVEIEPPAQSRYYSVLAVDAKGNRSPF